MIAAFDDTRRADKSNFTFRVRPFIPSRDQEFVFSSWLKSYRDAHDNLVARDKIGGLPHEVKIHIVPQGIYYEEQHEIIEDLMRKSYIIMACDVDEPNSLYGYLCFFEAPTINVVHYLYVKNVARGGGIGTELLRLLNKEKPIVYTHATIKGAMLAKKLNAAYNPYLTAKNIYEW